MALLVLFLVWFALSVIAQTKTRPGKWLFKHDRFCLFPPFNFFEDPLDHDVRLLVRICDPFGEVTTQWAYAAPLQRLTWKDAFLNRGLRYQGALYALEHALSEPAPDNDRATLAARSLVTQLVMVELYDYLKPAHVGTKLDGFAFQAALASSSENSCDIRYISEPRMIRSSLNGLNVN